MINQKIAIIGLGNIGQAIAANLSKSSRSYIVADRNIKKAEELALNWGKLVEVEPISNAIKSADLLILAIPFQEISIFLARYASDLEDKIIVDPSNAIAPDENGGFKKIIEASKSAGEINAGALPKNAKLAKALGTLGADSLLNAAYQVPEQAVLFYANDDITINPIIEGVINDIGFKALRIGDLSQSSRIEVFGDLHEFGALGKPVSIAEAKQKI
ncbi:NAD(P)-binding domain-containing protein [uncultured Flavobacterium sp.]|uniref:NADPH-dependent F420 reductase n=1 Tax=uncultured Flavobacterium sp. TaxID=165435 RepID=UPI0025FF89B7|nr:NAD(P)-binding domain-containing protein [uncultured Flavobacterium sp.]